LRPAKATLCESCQQVQPADKFLPASLSPTGYLTKCIDCIRKTAERHRSERARIAPANEQAEKRTRISLVPVSRPVDLANVRPVGQRLPPELYAAAKRFVFDFRDGRTQALLARWSPSSAPRDRLGTRLTRLERLLSCRRTHRRLGSYPRWSQSNRPWECEA
jgi:hypothetical protein